MIRREPQNQQAERVQAVAERQRAQAGASVAAGGGTEPQVNGRLCGEVNNLAV